MRKSAIGIGAGEWDIQLLCLKGRAKAVGEGSFFKCPGQGLEG